MSRRVQQIIVGLAGVMGGFAGLFTGFFPIVYLFAPYDWGIFSGIIGIGCGILAGAFCAARSGEIVGKFLERYE